MSTNTGWSCSFGTHPVQKNISTDFIVFGCVCWVVCVGGKVNDKRTRVQTHLLHGRSVKFVSRQIVNMGVSWFLILIAKCFFSFYPQLLSSIHSGASGACNRITLLNPPSFISFSLPATCFCPSSVRPRLGLPMCVFHFSKRKSSWLKPQLFWTLSLKCVCARERERRSK